MRHISQVIKEANDNIIKLKKGEIQPLRTSSNKLMNVTEGFFPSDQVVIAGRSGTGKTAVLINYIQDFCNPEINPFWHDKIIICYDSWEMTAWRNILRMYSRNMSRSVKSFITRAEENLDEFENRLNTMGEKLSKYPIYINSTSTDVDTWARERIEFSKEHPGKMLVNVVDHTRLVTKKNERTEEQLISRLMQAGIYLKNNYNMINLFLSQMNRNIETGNKDRSQAGTTPPIASDIFGSDMVFQAADIVIALHRPGIYGLPEFNGIPTGINPLNPNQEDNLLIKCILKQRDGWIGNLSYKHNLKINKIEDYAPHIN